MCEHEPVGESGKAKVRGQREESYDKIHLQ